MIAPLVARRLLSVALLALVVLHVAPPTVDDPAVLVLGWLPWDLAYPLLWMAAAALVVLFMTGAPWPDEPPPERQPPLPPAPPAGDP